MNFSMSVAESGQHIIVKVCGPITRQTAAEIAIAATQLGQEKNIQRFLQDLTASTNTETITNNYYFAHQDLQQPTINQAAIIACLVSPGDHSHDFVETAMQNAGYKIKIFTDEEKALAYLLQEPL